MDYALNLGTKFLLVFSSLLIIVDPLGLIPTFISLTQNMSADAVKKVTKRACLISAEVLIFFQLFGNFLFNILHIQLNAFKVAGGILLFLTALDMLKAKNVDDKYSPEVHEAGERSDISIVPLAMPLLAGPGAITSVIVYSNDPKGSFIENTFVSVLSIVLTLALAYWVLHYSAFIKKLLGNSGITVLQRVMGILLAAISLQLIVEGLTLLVTQIVGA